MLNHQPLQMPFAPLNGPAEERRRFVYRSSPRTDSSRLERPEADPLAGWRQAVFGTGSSCQWGQLKWQQFVFLFCFSFSPFYSYKLYFLYVDVMEALMVRSILLNNLLFCFLIMSKSVVPQPLPARDPTQAHWSRQDLNWRVGPTMFSTVTLTGSNSPQRSP